MFDVYLPIVALAPATAYFEPPGLSPNLKTTLYYSVFVASLIGRPLGATIFGHFGDKIGRRRTLLVATGGFSAITLLIALLPGYRQIGLASVILLLALRLLDGVFLGGEYTAANPLAMEYSPKQKRGINGAFITAGYAASSIAIAIVTAGVLYFMPDGGPGAPFVRWGWRIPFLVGFLLSAILFGYFFRVIPESEVWLSASKSPSPLKEMISGPNGRTLLQVFIMMSGVWLAFLAAAATLPRVLQDTLRMSSQRVTGSLVIVNAVLFLGYLLFGQLGQTYGRRRMLIIGGLLNSTVSPGLYYYLMIRGYRSTLEMTVLLSAIEVLAVGGTLAIPLAYITERFPTSVRASGFGAGWSIALIAPSFYGFMMLGLARFMPYEFTQLVLLAIGGVVMAIGAALGPETKDFDLAEQSSG